MIFSITWIVTGHQQFGQQGHVASLHVPWLGVGFLVLAPVGRRTDLRAADLSVCARGPWPRSA